MAVYQFSQFLPLKKIKASTNEKVVNPPRLLLIGGYFTVSKGEARMGTWKVGNARLLYINQKRAIRVWVHLDYVRELCTASEVYDDY